MISKDIREGYIQDAERSVESMLQQYDQGVKTLSDREIMRVLEQLVLVVRAHEELLEEKE